MAKVGRPTGACTPVKDRLLNRIKIDSATDCWIWQGGRNNVGYGMMRGEEKMQTAHRISYEEHKGDIPKGMCVLHNCDNPLCVNPDHLRLGTHKENTQDMIRRGRSNYFGFQDIRTCVHCGKQTSPSMHARWHNDNCKHKANSINTISAKSTSACA